MYSILRRLWVDNLFPDSSNFLAPRHQESTVNSYASSRCTVATSIVAFNLVVRAAKNNPSYVVSAEGMHDCDPIRYTVALNNLRSVFVKRFIVVAVFLVALPAYAIVDVHDEYFSNFDVSTFSVFNFNFKGSSGNKDQSAFKLQNHTIHRQKDSTWLFVGSIDVAETNQIKSEDSTFAHLRYTHKLSGPHGAEIFSQYSQDVFKRLERREVLGAGYRYEWIEGKQDQRSVLGTGIIREHERYVDIEQAQRLWRGNLYVTVAMPLTIVGSKFYEIYEDVQDEDRVMNEELKKIFEKENDKRKKQVEVDMNLTVAQLSKFKMKASAAKDRVREMGLHADEIEQAFNYIGSVDQVRCCCVFAFTVVVVVGIFILFSTLES